MIKVNVLKKDNIVDKIIIKGHANYDIIGKDIVCSAASSIVITTINGILSIDESLISYIESKDLLTINILKKDLISLKLIDNMLDLLNELSMKYPKNIMIKEGVNNE
jgi:uncharacterized protein YsxB (DUF464 family)